MKKFIMVVLLISGTLVSSAQSKDEKQVTEAVQQLRKAMVDGDSLTLMKLTFPSLTYGHSSTKVETQQEFVSNIASGRSDFVTIDLSEQTISIHGKTAIVRHTLIAATNDGGRPGTVKLLILLVWQKDRKSWKLLARQAARFPQ
jgi:ketosteroid isomerase-like protein